MKMKILLLLCKSSAYGLLHVSRDKDASADGSHHRWWLLRDGATKTCRLSSVATLPDLLLYAVSPSSKNQSAPFSRPDCQNEKSKIFAHCPMPVPLGGCEKRTPLRSFRLSANQPSTDTPNVKYFRSRFFIFFFPLRSL